MNEKKTPVNCWKIAALAALLIYVGLMVWFYYHAPDPNSFLGKATADFEGNLLGGFICSVLFLLIASSFSSSMERNVREMHAVVREEGILRKQERSIKEFEDFLKHQSYYDIRLPDLKIGSETLGLSYTIEPVRDEQGQPIKRSTEMWTYYVIKVRGPAHESVLDEETLFAYEESPIRDGEYYFCRYHNDDWHLTRAEPSGDWYRFYLSGRLGPVEYGQSANEFMGLSSLPAAHQIVATFMVNADGTKHQNGPAYQWELITSTNGEVWVRSNRSPLKRVYERRAWNDFTLNEYFLFIDGMRGYFHGEALENFKQVIREQVKAKGLTPAKVDDWDADDQD